ncbi:MAG: hypothetical protein HYW86_01560 [Candidatus Roizmanbacteria bacterium]|nr:MAG: hypothetical protein HYW86_01560 [Candidatus Roizmanbacteria bacterium]
MSAEARRVLISTDIDGIQEHAPFPFGTFKDAILKGQIKIPGSDSERVPSSNPTGLIGIALMGFKTLFHEIRPDDKRGNEGLINTCTLFQERGAETKVVALSGRESFIHEMTIRKLKKSRIGGLVSEFHLSDEKSSSKFKVRRFKKFMKEDQEQILIHFEDDPKAAEAIARLGIEEAQRTGQSNRVWVVMKETLSSSVWVLKRGKLELSPNVIRKRDLRKVPEEFKQIIASGQMQLLKAAV